MQIQDAATTHFTTARGLMSGSFAPADDPAEALVRAIVEEFDHGVLLLDEDGQLVAGNSLGLAALRDHWALTLRGRHVATAASGDALRFLALRTRAARGFRGMEVFGQGRDRVTVAVAPMRLPGGPRAATVMVTLSRRAACDRLTLENYARLHRLTAAEHRVLESIIEGIAPAEIAGRHGVSVSTVRTQIGHLLQKSGCSSMRMLLGEVARLPPLRPALTA